MIKKSGVDIKNWDKQLKFILFAYRDTPHCVTGFSPFTLIFGREVRGPLGFLSDFWMEKNGEDGTVFEWLECVKAKMKDMAEIVSERERKAKDVMKKFYDRKATVKCFEEGDLVLFRRPGINAKMGASWDGPFEVVQQVSPVTYKIKVPGGVKKGKIFHSNMLKKWIAPKVHRVGVIVDDVVDEVAPGLKLVRDGFVPTDEQQASLDDCLGGFGDVLNPDPGRTNVLSLNINTGDHAPVSSHPYSIPPRWKDDVKLQIDQLLSLGIISPSTSPWSSSVVTVRKKDGGIRICIDFRAVNAITVADPYQMPLIEEILDRLATAKFISKVDLNKGFHQIPVEVGDKPKTAFCTPWGKFHFNFMPFGLRNGPAVFQRLMDQILHKDKEWSYVYIDDIAIFSEDWSTHCKDIAHVLQSLREAGLTANVQKCQFGQTQCEFLGHVVGHGKVSPAELKVQAVRDFERPRTKKNVRQFLGLSGYYRRFIHHYAEHSFRLSEATKKSSPEEVVWCDDMLCEFEYLKSALCCMPCLTLPTVKDKFVLQTDASGVGLGAVLSVLRSGEELPVAFFSKKLQPRERKFCATELEAFAVVTAVTHFDAYLATHPFILETDHKALTFLNSANHANGRLARWALKLQPFDFTIRYRPGPENLNADALSRLVPQEDKDSLPPRPSVNHNGGEMS